MSLNLHTVQRELNDLYEKCARKKPEFDAFITRLAFQVGGTAVLAPLKPVDRALEKVVSSLGGRVTGLTDILRATLVFETVSEVLTAHETLLKQLPVLRERNLYRDNLLVSDGYRDAKIDFDLDRITVELQLNTRAMLAAKEKAHLYYEEKRKLLATKRSGGRLSSDEARRLRELDRIMRAIYREANDV